MNNRTLGGVILVVLIILGAGSYFFFSKSSVEETKDDTTTQIADSQATNVPEKLNSIRALFEAGKDMQCSFSVTDGDLSQSGTTYVSDGQLRGDITIDQGSGNIQESHIILTEGWTYAWGAGFEDGTGLKIEMPEEDATMDETDTEDNSFVDLDEEIEYDCSSWKKDAAMFVPPSDITFKNFSLGGSIAETLNTNSSGGLDCSVCDQAPGEDAQAECRAALGC